MIVCNLKRDCGAKNQRNANVFFEKATLTAKKRVGEFQYINIRVSDYMIGDCFVSSFIGALLLVIVLYLGGFCIKSKMTIVSFQC